MCREDAAKLARAVDHGDRQDRPEPRCGCDRTVGTEARISLYVADQCVRARPRSPAADRLLVVDNGEMMDEVAVEAAMDGRIEHSLSIVALLRAARRLGV